MQCGGEDMYKYLFKLNKELLDLSTIKIDDKCMNMFDKVKNSKTIEFINEKDESKEFKLNRDEKSIEGRGIKGFFQKYEAEYIFMEFLGGNKFKIYDCKKNSKTELNKFDVNVENKDRMEQVIKRSMQYE